MLLNISRGRYGRSYRRIHLNMQRLPSDIVGLSKVMPSLSRPRLPQATSLPPVRCAPNPSAVLVGTALFM